MTHRNVRNIAVAVMVTAAVAVPAVLGATTASAATTAATATSRPAQGGEGTECVFETFAGEPYRQECVYYLQVLLNDLYNDHKPGPDQRLSTDGYYGMHTQDDVQHFNGYYFAGPGRSGSPVATPGTWYQLCQADDNAGFHGVYWHDAGCPAILYLAEPHAAKR